MAKKVTRTRPLYITEEAHKQQEAERAARLEARRLERETHDECEAAERRARRERQGRHRAEIKARQAATRVADAELRKCLDDADVRREALAGAKRTTVSDIENAKADARSLEAERDRLLRALDDVESKLGSKLGKLRKLEQRSLEVMAVKADEAVARVREVWARADAAWQDVSAAWKKKNRDRKLKNRAKELLLPLD